MTRQQRISVIAILCLGIGGSICSLVRIAYVDVLGVGFGLKLLQQAPSFAIVSCIEVGLGITCINCATLRPMFQRYLGLSQTTYNSSGRYGRQTGATATRRTNGMGTEVGIEHDVELDGMSEQEKNPGAITVTTLIAHDVEANVRGGRVSHDSDKELLH